MANGDTVGSTAPVGGFGIGDLQSFPIDLLSQFLLPLLQFGPQMAGQFAQTQGAADLATQQANNAAAMQVAGLASSTGLRDALQARNFVRGVAPQPGFGSAFAGTAPFQQLTSPNIGDLFSGFNQQLGGIFGGASATPQAPTGGGLFRSTGNDAVFLDVNGTLRHIPNRTIFDQLGLNMANVQELNAPISTVGPVGSPINLFDAQQFLSGLNPTPAPSLRPGGFSGPPISTTSTGSGLSDLLGRLGQTSGSPGFLGPPVSAAGGGTISGQQARTGGVLVGERAPEMLRLTPSGDIEITPIIAQAQNGLRIEDFQRPAPLPGETTAPTFDPNRTRTGAVTGSIAPAPTSQFDRGGAGPGFLGPPVSDTTSASGFPASLSDLIARLADLRPPAGGPPGFLGPPVPTAPTAPPPLDIPATRFLGGSPVNPTLGPMQFDLPELGLMNLAGPAAAASLFRPGILTGQERQDMFDLFGIGGIPQSVAQFFINQATPGFRNAPRQQLGLGF